MGKLVFFQVTRLSKGFIILQTSKGLCPTIFPFVNCETVECCEILATLLACEVHGGRWLGADRGIGARLQKWRGSMMEMFCYAWEELIYHYHFHFRIRISLQSD